MNFWSLHFAVFAAAALAAYWLTARWRIARAAVLTVTGYVFYAQFHPLFLVLLFAVSVVNHFLSKRIAGVDRGSTKALVALGVAFDLSLLAVFKYADFVLQTIATVADWFGATVEFDPLGIALPVGISFYVFQSISHTVEVHRGKTKPSPTLVDHLAYMAFFPRLVAGPIVRSHEFVPQLDERPRVTKAMFGLALFLLISGFAKKLAVADTLTLNIVDRVFDFPRMYTAAEVLLAAYAFTIQIYCDFSGYTDIALGLALLFGLKLPENFDFPYRATDLRDFWRRWHMTLSFWLRDFLYISMGGARVATAWKIYRNLMITMVLGGLWHGAGWTFVFWGFLHGLGLSVTRWFQRWRKRRGREASSAAWMNALKALVTFHFVALAWVFFRADSMQTILDMWGAFAFGGLSIGNVDSRTLILMAVAAAGMWLPPSIYLRVRETFRRLPVVVQIAIAAGAGYAIWRLAAGEVTPFVYEKF